MRKIIGNTYTITAIRLVWVYLVYFLMRILFYVYNRDLLNLDLSGSNLWDILRGGLLFDTSAICYTNSLFILLSLLPFRHRTHPKYQRWVALSYYIPNSAAIIANLADTVYFRFTGKRTTFSVFSEFNGEEWWNFRSFFLSYWEITLLGILLILLLVFLFRLTHIRPGKRVPAKYFYSFSLGALVLAGVGVVWGIRGTHRADTWPITAGNAAIYVSKPEQTSLVLNTPFTLIRSIGKEGLTEERYFSDEEARRIFSPIYSLPDTTAAHQGIFEGRNVMVIIWESLSREWVGELNRDVPGYKGFTPFLDSLCQHSYVMTNAYANGTMSVDAMPAILASLPRVGESFTLSPYTGNELNSVVKILKGRGYHTAFFHGASTISLGFAAFSRQIGFDKHFSRESFDDERYFDGHWGIYDDAFLQYAAQEQNRMKEPFFTTLFTLSSHYPFHIPADLQHLFPEEKLDMQRSIRYSDYSLRKFFEAASTMPWYQNTLFIILGDHSVTGDLEKYKNNVGRFAIPIILYDPQGGLVGRDDTLTQQIDVMPLLLHLMGYRGKFIAYGHNPLSLRDDHFTLHHETATYFINRDSLHLSMESGQAKELYNVRNDPQLQRNLVTDPAYATPRDTMLSILKAFAQIYTGDMIHNRMSLNPSNQ